MTHLYQIKSPSGKVYVGVTSNFNKRMEAHRRTNHKNLKSEIDKHGFDAMNIEILKTYKHKSVALHYEKEMIEEYQEKDMSLNGDCGLNYMGIQIDESTKIAFDKLCKSIGSNMSVEIKRYIYEQLKQAGK